MSSFLNSIVRGAGSQIGRNIVGNLGKATTNNRYYATAQNEIEKALNLPIKGKADTIFENCFILYQSFDDECRSSYNIIGTSNRDFLMDIMLRTSRINYYTECMEKIRDCKEYLELKGGEDETIEKIEQIKGKINSSFAKYVNRICEGILNLTKKDDLEIAKNAWYNMGLDNNAPLNQLYGQTTKNSEIIVQIENHLNVKTKSFWSNLF